MYVKCQQLNHDSASWNHYHNMPLVKHHVVKLKTLAHHTHYHWSCNTSIIHINDSADTVQYWTEEDNNNCLLTWVVGTVAISNHCLTQNHCSLPASFEQQLFANCWQLHCIFCGSYHSACFGFVWPWLTVAISWQLSWFAPSSMIRNGDNDTLARKQRSSQHM